MNEAEKIEAAISAIEKLKKLEPEIKSNIFNNITTIDCILIATMLEIIKSTEVPNVTIVTDNYLNDTDIIGLA
tara:strand:- start:4552 stop:4770 length:219 start_codon:yes stop_codon:yes gene_type:complete